MLFLKLGLSLEEVTIDDLSIVALFVLAPIDFHIISQPYTLQRSWLILIKKHTLNINKDIFISININSWSFLSVFYYF